MRTSGRGPIPPSSCWRATSSTPPTASWGGSGGRWSGTVSAPTAMTECALSYQFPAQGTHRHRLHWASGWPGARPCRSRATPSIRWTTSSRGDGQILAGAALEWHVPGRGRAAGLRARGGPRIRGTSCPNGSALSAALRPIAGWSLAGGADYDLRLGMVGQCRPDPAIQPAPVRGVGRCPALPSVFRPLDPLGGVQPAAVLGGERLRPGCRWARA